jgi:hypothetical protein
MLRTHKNRFIIILVIALQLLVAGSLQAQKITNYDKKISQADKGIKKYLVPLIHGKWDYFAKYGYGVKISSDRDILNLKFIPIKIYNMDSVSIFSFDSNSAPERLLVLDTNKAVFYGIQDNKPVLAVFPEYRQGQWINSHGYGAIFPKLAEKVWNIINNKGTIFELDVYAFPNNTGGYTQYTQGYIVFNDGRQLMSILPDGATQPLKEALVQLRLDLIQGDKMDKEMRRNKEKQKTNP